MGKKKNPHISSWKVWILVLSTTQMLSTVQIYRIQYQNAQIHQHLWDSIIQQSQIVKKHIESTNHYLTEQTRLDIKLLEKLRQLLEVD